MCDDGLTLEVNADSLQEIFLAEHLIQNPVLANTKCTDLSDCPWMAESLNGRSVNPQAHFVMPTLWLWLS